MRTNYRYTIMGLLFLATTINYIDRQIIGLLKPILETEFHWIEKDYADTVFWFQAMYALGYVLSGRFIDKVGAKIGYGLAVFAWSIAAMAHGFVKTTAGFIGVRGALGFTEAANFPAAIKSIAEWFPVKERSLASGIMISGSTVGPLIAPAGVLWMANHYGWRTAFIVTGALGLVWVVAWYLLYSRPAHHKRVNKEELAFITAGQLTAKEERIKVPLPELLTKKATWGYFLATFLTDAIWWFYLFWLPSYLTSQGLSKTEIAFPITIVYAVTALLSISGGWLSSYFIKRGWTVNRSRKTTMFICVATVLPVMLVRFSQDIWLSVFIIAFAAGSQTVWKGVLLTTVTDQFPKGVVGSVSGIGGLGGAVGGMLAAQGVGMLLDAYKAANNLHGGYNLIFVCCGTTFLTATVLFHLLSPRLERVKFKQKEKRDVEEVVR
jgi:ACS family hexuronate transporter-like MFS transporter